MRLLQGTLLFYAAVLVLDLGYFVAGKYRTGGFDEDIVPVYSFSPSSTHPSSFRVHYAIATHDTEQAMQVLNQSMDALTPQLNNIKICLSSESGQCYLDFDGDTALAKEAALRFHRHVDSRTEGGMRGVIWRLSTVPSTLS